jgi:hypothetical protein
MAKELATLAFERSKLTAESAVQLAALTKQKADADAEGLIATILAQSRKDEEGAKALLARVAASTEATRAGLLEKQLGQDQEHANMVRTNDEHLRLEKAETDAAIARLAAIQPRLIAALERLGESELLEKIASHLNVQSILGGTSVSDALNKAFAGTRFANLLTEVADER